jgi:hypothetical protein
MTREMTTFAQSTETAPEPAAAGGPTSEMIAGAFFVSVYLALWACVSATVFGPVSSVFG